MRKAIICDLDGTLADCSHRLHHITGKKDWAGFFFEMEKDPVINPTATILAAFYSYNYDMDIVDILFVSGRPEDSRQITTKWLLENNLAKFSTLKLYMRKSGDFRQDYIVKDEILTQILTEGYEILFAIDDRPSIISLWNRRGIFTFQVKSHWDKPEIANGKLTLMIGPTGAGKSSWLQNKTSLKRFTAKDLGIFPSQIISSDALREEICGDFKDQSQNEKVFKTLYNLAKYRLSCGLDVVIDATNLRRSDRNRAIEITQPKTIRYIVINRPMSEKISTAGWRLDIPSLLKKHEESFQKGLKEILSGDEKAEEVIDLRH